MRSGESGRKCQRWTRGWRRPGSRVFRWGTLCPGLTAADGLAPNKSGRRMNHLTSYFSYSEEKRMFQILKSINMPRCGLCGGICLLRLVFDFNIAYFIPFSGYFCLWRGAVCNITLSLYHYWAGSLNTDTQQPGGINTKHKRGIGSYFLLREYLHILCSFMFNSIGENLLHEIFSLCCLKCFRSFSSWTKFVPWAFPPGRSTWKFSCESRASVSSSNK